MLNIAKSAKLKSDTYQHLCRLLLLLYRPNVIDSPADSAVSRRHGHTPLRHVCVLDLDFVLQGQCDTLVAVYSVQCSADPLDLTETAVTWRG